MSLHVLVYKVWITLLFLCWASLTFQSAVACLYNSMRAVRLSRVQVIFFILLKKNQCTHISSRRPRISVKLSEERETKGFPRLGETYTNSNDTKFRPSESFPPSAVRRPLSFHPIKLNLSTPPSLLIIESWYLYQSIANFALRVVVALKIQNSIQNLFYEWKSERKIKLMVYSWKRQLNKSQPGF